MNSFSLKQAIALVISLGIFCHGGCATKWFSTEARNQSKTALSDNELIRLREAMVREQIQNRDIRNPAVLAAMLKVPRHAFVPAALLPSAYDDNALPLMLGQTISQPYIVGYMTQALRLEGARKVLEIGTGSGYQAAILAEIVADVYSIEILPKLAEYAKTILAELGYRNIHFLVGDGYQGWPEYAPFDRIIVTAAPDHVPHPLIDQLAQGGLMVIPVGKADQQLMVIEKKPSGIARRYVLPVRFVPMTGKAQKIQ